MAWLGGVVVPNAVLGAEPTAVATIVRTDTPPLIDGRLDEALWQRAAVISDFHQIRPGDGTPPSERTEVYLLYDKDALYIGARMWDSEPDRINANLMKQGSGLREDDRLAVILDPFNTGRSGYRFEVNLNGVRNEMLYQSVSQFQAEWTVIWEAKGARFEQGWTVEIAIPFKTLPFNPNIESWGFNVSRAIRRRGEEVLWVSRNRSWNPSILGQLRGFTGMDQGKGLDVVPGVSTARRKVYATSKTETSVDPSLDVYYRITPSLNASLTVNTDFSATEVDDRQVNLSRFNLFFPEKRDFFLNDSDYFEFGRLGLSSFLANVRSVGRPNQENGRPFFSRRLGLSPLGSPVDLNYGGKLSGRIGRFAVGALGVRQDEFVTPQGARIAPSNLFVGRATMDVLSESSIGVIATAGDPTSNLSNSLIGMDFLFLNSHLSGGRTIEAEGWFQKSDTEGLQGDDAAFGVGLRVPNAEGVRLGLAAKELQENFYPALGFVNRTGIRDYAIDMGYNNVLQSNVVQSVFVGFDAERIESIDGGLETQIVTARPFEIETRTQDTFKPFYAFNREVVGAPFTIFRDANRTVRIPVGDFRFQDYGFNLESAAQRRFSGKLTFRKGDFYDGERLNLGGEFLWKPSPHFAWKVGYDWNDIELPQGDFVLRLARTTVEVPFTSQLIWVNIVQYDNSSELLGMHSRLQWIPRAGQEWFLVLNHNMQDFENDNRFSSVTSEAVAKVSYTFRF